MKAITLWQPWAQLVAIGAKPTETRAWATSYRGRLAIHASKNIGRNLIEAREIIEMGRAEPFKTTLSEAGFTLISTLPRSAILCIVTLVDCIPTERYKPALFLESTFGDFSARRFAWVFRDVELLPNPIPCSGHQGLWDWNEVGFANAPKIA